MMDAVGCNRELMNNIYLSLYKLKYNYEYQSYSTDLKFLCNKCSQSSKFYFEKIFNMQNLQTEKQKKSMQKITAKSVSLDFIKKC